MARKVVRNALGPDVYVALREAGLCAAAVAASIQLARGQEPAVPPLPAALHKHVAALLQLAELRADQAVSKAEPAAPGPERWAARRLPLVKAAPKPPEGAGAPTKRAPEPHQPAAPAGAGRPRAAELSFTKSEAVRPHLACGQPLFEDDSFVGCICLGDAARGAHTVSVPGGYQVILPSISAVRTIAAELRRRR